MRAVIFMDANPSDELYVLEGKCSGALHVTPKGGEKKLLAQLDGMCLRLHIHA